MFDISKKKHKGRNINRITLIRKKQRELKMAKRRKAKKKGKKKAKKRRRR